MYCYTTDNYGGNEIALMHQNELMNEIFFVSHNSQGKLLLSTFSVQEVSLV